MPRARNRSKPSPEARAPLFPCNDLAIFHPRRSPVDLPRRSRMGFDGPRLCRPDGQASTLTKVLLGHEDVDVRGTATATPAARAGNGLRRTWHRPWTLPAAVAFGGATVVVLGHTPVIINEPGFVVVVAIVTASLFATGVVLLRVESTPAPGLGCIATGALFGVAGADGWPRYGSVISFVFAGAYTLPLGWAILRYRSPRMGQLQRLWLYCAILFIGGGTIIQTILSRPEWNKYPTWVWWPTVLSDRRLYDTVTTVLLIAWVGLAISFIYLQVRRGRSANFVDREALVPFTVGSGLYCAAVSQLSCCSSWFLHLPGTTRSLFRG